MKVALQKRTWGTRGQVEHESAVCPATKANVAALEGLLPAG